MSFDSFDDATPPDDFSDGSADHMPRTAVLIKTRTPVDLSVSPLDDARAPESSALAAFIDGRLVARSAMPRESIDRLIELRLFEAPVRLGLFAYEAAPGLQCRLLAFVPRALLEASTNAAEPWKSSVPSFEAMQEQGKGRFDRADDADDDDDDDDDADSREFETILLGHIVRFEKDRQHRDNLGLEAVDVLQRIIHGAAPLADADERAIDDLLGSL